jgi:hypothetical protein
MMGFPPQPGRTHWHRQWPIGMPRARPGPYQRHDITDEYEDDGADDEGYLEEDTVEVRVERNMVMS